MAEGAHRGSTATADDCFPITGDDATDLAVTCRAIVLAVGGVVKLTTGAGQIRTVTLPAGQFNCRIKRVWSTSLTASGITGLV